MKRLVLRSAVPLNNTRKIMALNPSTIRINLKEKSQTQTANAV